MLNRIRSLVLIEFSRFEGYFPCGKSEYLNFAYTMIVIKGGLAMQIEPDQAQHLLCLQAKYFFDYLLHLLVSKLGPKVYSISIGAQRFEENLSTTDLCSLICS